jgi:enoyl-CoA hydratase
MRELDVSKKESGAVRVRWDERAEGRIAVIAIDNRSKMNALNSRLMKNFTSEVTACAMDESVRVIVVTGAGEKAFISGADIGEMAQLEAGSARDFIGCVHGCCEAIRRAPVPVIARMQGYTFGAGLELAAACDIRVASSNAQFGMPEVRLGIPSVVEAALLPTLVGWGRAREILLLGEIFPAAKALEWGLVNRVVEARDLDDEVGKAITSILACGPKALRIQKALLARWETLPLRDAIATGIDAFASAWASDEPSRMMSEFLARQTVRKPVAIKDT